MTDKPDPLAEARAAGLAKASISTHPPADSSKHPAFAPTAIKNAYATRPEEDDKDKPDEAESVERR